MKSFLCLAALAGMSMLTSCGHSPYDAPAYTGKPPFDQIQPGPGLGLERHWTKKDGWTTYGTLDLYVPYAAMTQMAREELEAPEGRKKDLLKRVRQITFYAARRSVRAKTNGDFNLICRIDTTIMNMPVFIACHPERVNAQRVVLKDFDVWASIAAPVFRLAGKKQRIQWRSWIAQKLEMAIHEGTSGVLESSNQGASIEKLEMKDWYMNVVAKFEDLPPGTVSTMGHPTIRVEALDQ